MKKVLLAAAVLVVAPVASANVLFTIGAKASVWDAAPSGQLDTDLSVEDASNGVKLGSENGTQITVFVEHPLPIIPNIKFKSTALDLSGAGSVDVEFDGVQYDGDMSAKLDLSHNDLTLYWGLPLPIPYLDINFGVTARQFDGVAEVVGDVLSVTEPVTTSVDLDMVLPMVYGEIKLGSPFGLYAAADINYVGYGDNKLTDMSAVLGYDLPIPVVDLGIELGYRSMSLKTDKDDVDIAADLKVKGLFYGASLSFGF